MHRLTVPVRPAEVPAGARHWPEFVREPGGAVAEGGGGVEGFPCPLTVSSILVLLRGISQESDSKKARKFRALPCTRWSLPCKTKQDITEMTMRNRVKRRSMRRESLKP